MAGENSLKFQSLCYWLLRPAQGRPISRTGGSPVQLSFVYFRQIKDMLQHQACAAVASSRKPPLSILREVGVAFNRELSRNVV
jgi:hypothetical protein